MEKRKYKKVSLLWLGAVLFLSPIGVAIGEDAAATSKKAEEPAPKSELDTLKAEWEAVREQQVQMIREKEDQLEKLKEEIFVKMKALNVPAASQSRLPQPEPSKASGLAPQGAAIVPTGSFELEAQKAALQVERQKLFEEISRQKESLRQLQFFLDGKARELAVERDRFEQEKKTTVR